MQANQSEAFCQHTAGHVCGQQMLHKLCLTSLTHIVNWAMILRYKQLASTTKLYPPIILYHIHKTNNVRCAYRILTGKLESFIKP